MPEQPYRSAHAKRGPRESRAADLHDAVVTVIAVAAALALTLATLAFMGSH
jgi:hypothetical protein